jgi:ribosomal protein S13
MPYVKLLNNRLWYERESHLNLSFCFYNNISERLPNFTNGSLGKSTTAVGKFFISSWPRRVKWSFRKEKKLVEWHLKNIDNHQRKHKCYVGSRKENRSPVRGRLPNRNVLKKGNSLGQEAIFYTGTHRFLFSFLSINPQNNNYFIFL